MGTIFKTHTIQQESVSIASEIDTSFEELYISIRDKEQRVLNDEQVANLPNCDKGYPHFNEWKLRQQSTKKFVNYLEKNNFKNLLEIGCGNGWFSNQCSLYVEHTIGIDINLTELKQAARVFKKDALKFVYWDIFTDNPFEEKFDIIVINASIQYFKDLPLLLIKIQSLLAPNGELHILDSPFYNSTEIEAAKQRTHSYYSSHGVPELAAYYNHHDIKLLQDFEILHKPTASIFKKLVGIKENPFNWLRKTYH